MLEISALVIVLPPLPFPLPLFVVLATLKFRATSLLFVRAALLLEPPIVLIAAPLQVFVPALLTEATLLLLLPLLLLLSLLFPLPPLFGAFLVLALPISVPLAVVSTPLLLLLSSLFLRLLLLFFLSLDPSLTAVSAILRAHKTGNSKRGRHRDGKSDRQPSKITGFHDYLRKNWAEGKVVSAA
ncbi:MAG TPA: hypothetical protein VGQ72_11565 [Pyrinomonadaceae bacterium]|nr:hypothetical protein [Pyrinomonadaceae bacterium]